MGPHVDRGQGLLSTRVSERRFATSFLLPGGIWLLLLFLVPLGILLAISYGTTDDLGNAIYGWHPGNYSRVFDSIYVPVLLRSVGFALATVGLCLLIGYPVAYYIAVFGGRWKNVLVAMVVLPFFVNYLVRTYAWIAMLGDEGLVNGLFGSDVRFINTPYAVIGGLVYGYLAFMLLPIYAALDRMDPALIEAGKDLYGSRWQTFLHVTLPHTRQGVYAGMVLVFLPAVGDFVSAQLLGGPDEYMVGNLIQQQFFGAEDWPFGAALTTVMMFFLLGFMILYLRSARQGGRGHVSVETAQLPAAQAAPARRAKAFDRPRFLRVFAVLFYTFLFAPIVLVILFSFNSSRSLQNFDGFSLRWYRAFFESESLRSSLIASVEIALVTMAVATVLGTMLAYGLVRAKTRWSGAANVLMLVPLVTPEIVAGASALLLFTQLGMQLSLTTIMLGHITFSISYVTVVVRGRLASLGPEVENAALDLGATRAQTFVLVTLPELWPAILASGLLVFALSFDDFVMSFFTTGESPQPLPVRIWSAIRFGVTPTINAIGSFMLAVSLLAIGLALVLPRLLGRRESGLGVLVGREGA